MPNDEEINLKEISKNTKMIIVCIIFIIVIILLFFYSKSKCYYVEEGNRYIEYINFSIESEISKIELLLEDDEYIRIVECKPKKEDCYNIQVCKED